VRRQRAESDYLFGSFYFGYRKRTLVVLVLLRQNLLPRRSGSGQTVPKMEIREKELEDQPWIERLLSERWGWEGRVIAHGEIFDARTLPALVAGD
jgi:hypothetical protein